MSGPKKPCKIEDCNRVVYCKAMCRMHYKRVLRHGHAGRLKFPDHIPCATKNCQRMASAGGLCDKHYLRMRRYGRTEKVNFPQGLCTVESCDQKAYTKDRCRHHHEAQRWLVKSEQEKTRVKLWRMENPEKLREHSATARAHRNQAIPKWLTKEQKEEIKQIYFNCPEGYEVDHIYPIRGRTSCGLHVPQNLQYLTVTENRIKGNRI